VKALDLPGDGRFEVRVDAQGTPITLRGRLEAEDGYAHLTLEGEPEKKLTVPLPPGIESIKLTRGAARINRR